MRNSILSIAFLLFCIVRDASPNTNEIALVMKCRGLVSVSYHGGRGHAMVSKGYLILPGARLQTGSGGFAIVKYISSRSVVIIRPRSEAIFNAFQSENGTNESLEMKTGEALLDVLLPRKHSFDLHTAAALVSFRKNAQTFVILSKNDQGTALYNLSGSAQIADNNFTTWRALDAEMAAFAAQNGFVQLSKLPKSALPRLRTIFDSTRKLTAGPLLVHDLVIKAGPNGTTEPSGKVVALSGVAVDIKAVSETEKIFTGWKVVDGNAYIKDIASAETQVAVTSNTLIEALFEETPSILRIVKSKHGTTEPKGDIYLQRGSPVTIRLAPNEGYSFAGWKTSSNVKIEEVDEFATRISVNAARGKVSPRFIKKSYQLTVQKSENGTSTPKDAQTVYHGDSTAITAVPHEGYQFIRWDIVEGHADITNLRGPTTTVICDSVNAVIQPLFSDNAVEVSILTHELADEISPRGNFYVIRNSLFTVEVKTKTGMMVSRWLVERGKARVEGNEHAVIKCKTPFEIKPVITEQEYDLTLLHNKYGSVNPEGTHTVLYKRPVTIEAEPNEGMHFIRWQLSGGWADIADPQHDSTRVVLTHGDAVIKAEFAETICTLNVAATHGGYTEPSGPVKNYEGGDVIIQAIPNPKAAFIGWDIVEGKDNILFSDTLTIAEQTITSRKGNASVNALFSTETVQMTVLTNGLGTTVPEGKIYAVKNKWTPLKAVPNENQAFVQWTVITGTDIRFKDPFFAETEINPGAEEVVIKALFQSSTPGQSTEGTEGDVSLPDTCTLQIIYDKSKGSIDTDDEMTVKPGTPIVVTAKANKGYLLEGWQLVKGKASFSDMQNATITVVLNNDDAVITPVFRLKPLHTLEIMFKDYEGASKTIRSTYR